VRKITTLSMPGYTVEMARFVLAEPNLIRRCAQGAAQPAVAARNKREICT
jgi:hypothetical protein